MVDLMIQGIPVSFPFEPYDVQKAYMEKLIECLQSGFNGVLESPTGTGKTLSILCSSLAWLLVKKAQIQISIQTGDAPATGFAAFLKNNLKNASGKNSKSDEPTNSWGLPKIIYASRTHSQLSQAMQELKRTNYRHVKAAVLGSRDQMCIHPEVSKETNNANKIHMCQAKVKSRTCYFHTNVESKKEDSSVKDNTILDIEDLVKVGKKLSCCPYYLAKDLKQTADIIFMPYNYLLDPKARKANGIELANNVIILDEAHNVERMCEDSASLQIRSTDIALCIDEITHVMKVLSENKEEGADFNGTLENSQPKDFTPEDLCTLKTIFLSLEKAIDEIDVKPGDGITFDGSYIFDLLMKAQIHDNNANLVCSLIDSLVQYLATLAGSSPFQRKGAGLQKFSDLLNIIYGNNLALYKKRIMASYKIHVHIEEKKTKKSDSWSTVKTSSSNSAERVLSYWCFSPGFGMKQLLDQQVRCIILTSGTLAPLKPLISELAIPINVRLENPHIVKESQVFVKVISHGPDGQLLNSNFENRNNPNYIMSLGRTILSFTRVVPDGLLVFFPSYPILSKCQEVWQVNGIWTSISNIKPIYVEPQRKDNFNSIMSEFYNKISDVTSRGACFLAVCRGKVSEGLDFADMNGRAVVITGLPFPPFKDPRIILKKKYLEEQRAKDKEYLSGDEWYSLEASRAVNQAIGRVIRHKNDYGAILLCDTRFNNPKLKNQLSGWLRSYCNSSVKFGETISELCRFFKNAEKDLPSPRLKPLKPSEDLSNYHLNNDVVSQSSSNIRIVPKKRVHSNNLQNLPKSSEVVGEMNYYINAKNSMYKETGPQKASDLFSALDMKNDPAKNYSATAKVSTSVAEVENVYDQVVFKNKKKKLKILPLQLDLGENEDENSSLVNIKKAPGNLIDFVKCVKTSLSKDNYKLFQSAVTSYKSSNNYTKFLDTLDTIFFPWKSLHYLLRDMNRFLKDEHKTEFQKYCEKLS